MKPSQAFQVMKDAHSGQVDKCGQSYWAHPFQVGLIATHLFGLDEDLIVVCLLHDVLEDTAARLFLADMTSVQKDALFAITKDAYGKETYKEYIKRVSKNELATKTKLADLEHNLSPERQDCLEEGERKGLEKRYLWAKEYLTTVLYEGGQ